MHVVFFFLLINIEISLLFRRLYSLENDAFSVCRLKPVNQCCEVGKPIIKSLRESYLEGTIYRFSHSWRILSKKISRSTHLDDISELEIVLDWSGGGSVWRHTLSGSCEESPRCQCSLLFLNFFLWKHFIRLHTK